MIPDFQSMMLPLLETVGSNGQVTTQELKAGIIKYFNLTKEEQEQKTPNNKQHLYYNRMAWAILHLKMAELITSPERSIYKITNAGLDVLKKHPEKITMNYLKQFDNYTKNRGPRKPKNNTQSITDEQEENDKTPDELLELGYSQVIESLKGQLKKKIQECDPFFFERLVLELLLKMGYGGSENDNSELTPKSGDEGIDGIIKEDKLGLDKIYIQAKKWENNVSRPEIQKFVGALQGKRATKGIFITTSDFTKDAYDYAKNLNVTVILLNGDKLAEYMIETELGVSLKHSYKIYSIDNDYFTED